MIDSNSVARNALRYNLVFRRAKLRLSQSALSERAAVSRPLVSDIEHGRANVTLDVIERLAVALETSVPDLLTPVRAGASDDDLERRSGEGLEAYVGARDFLAALDGEPAAEEPVRYSKRGRKPAVSP